MIWFATDMATNTDEVSPFSAAAADLENLRRLLRETVRGYCAKVEGDIERVRNAVVEEGDRKKKVPVGRLRDVRDMITLMRTLEVKPEKGRRRDLKKIEGLLEDLVRFIEDW